MAPTSKSYHLFVWSRELRGLSSIRSIPQMLPNFFCEGPCSKYFKICRPHSLCSNYFMLQYEASCLLFSCEVMSNSLWCHGLQHTRLLCPPLSPGICSNSCPLSRWCYLTISFSPVPFSCLQSFPKSRSFPMSQLFASGSQSTGASASASVFPMNIEGWFPLGLTGLKCLLQHHNLKASILWCSAFFMVQLFHPYMSTGKKHSFGSMDLCQQSDVSAFYYTV